MTTAFGLRLHDGPCEGTYMVKRAPLFLRAVRGPRGTDVLDQLDDTPEDGEAVYVYRRKGESGSYHVKTTSRKATGFYASGDYYLVRDQTPVMGEQFRSNEVWQAWAAEQPYCRYCGQCMLETEDPEAKLCADCAFKLAELNRGPLCRRCARPIPPKRENEPRRFWCDECEQTTPLNELFDSKAGIGQSFRQQVASINEATPHS